MPTPKAVPSSDARHRRRARPSSASSTPAFGGGVSSASAGAAPAAVAPQSNALVHVTTAGAATGAVAAGAAAAGGYGENNFNVVVRTRPPLPREADRNGFCHEVTRVCGNGRDIVIAEHLGGEDDDAAPASSVGGYASHRFTFDCVFDQDVTQERVYAEAARATVLSTLHGYNATVFAYGQTGSGKTFTMEGFDDEAQLRGIVPRAVEEIFSFIDGAGAATRFLVRASYLQIYNESVSDLLKPGERRRLAIREDAKKGFFVEGLSEWVIRSPAELFALLKRGTAARATSATRLNEVSSRSHAVLSVIIEQNETRIVAADDDDEGEEDGGAVAELEALASGQDANAAGNCRRREAARRAKAKAAARARGGMTNLFRVGKLNLVDLAGSERVHLSGATGQRLEESRRINQSLSALGNVIAALGERAKAGGGGAVHVPYRDSKLTRILSDSLGGNCRTTMMATVSAAAVSYRESLSTLKFANRAKNIRNCARVNEDVDEKTLLRQYERELRQLRDELSSRARGLVDKRRLLEVEDERKRAESERLEALLGMERLSQSLMAEKEHKRRLEERIEQMNSQMLQGGAAADAPSGGGGGVDVVETPAFQEALQLERARINEAFARRVQELEGEREVLEAEKQQTSRYKALLLKQRDIMVQLIDRLNERDQAILELQRDVDDYDEQQSALEDALDEKTAALIAAQKELLRRDGAALPAPAAAPVGETPMPATPGRPAGDGGAYAHVVAPADDPHRQRKSSELLRIVQQKTARQRQLERQVAQLSERLGAAEAAGAAQNGTGGGAKYRRKYKRLREAYAAQSKERAALKVILGDKMKTLADSIAAKVLRTPSSTPARPSSSLSSSPGGAQAQAATARTKKEITVLRRLIDASVAALDHADKKRRGALGDASDDEAEGEEEGGSTDAGASRPHAADEMGAPAAADDDDGGGENRSPNMRSPSAARLSPSSSASPKTPAGRAAASPLFAKPAPRRPSSSSVAPLTADPGVASPKYGVPSPSPSPAAAAPRVFQGLSVGSTPLTARSRRRHERRRVAAAGSADALRREFDSAAHDALVS